jgi:hypothetical protein
MMGVYLLPDDLSYLSVGFDLTVSESHEATVTITDHPVERGANISDHGRPGLPSVSVEVYMTNTPINDLNGRGSIQSRRLTFPDQGVLGIQTLPRASVLTFPEPFDRVKDTHDILEDLRVRVALLSVITSTRTYDSMLITRVSMPRDEKGGANFQLDFQQIRTVTTASVTAPKPAEKRGNGLVKKGAQTGKTGDPKDAAKGKSLAVKALTSLGVLGG